MLKRNWKFFLISFVLSFSLCSPSLGRSGNDILKIGLFYSSNALPAANLQNVTGYGEGYQIGYFDGNRDFVSLYTVGNSKITIVKDKLIYISSNNTYYDVIPQSYTSVISPYHLQLNETFTTTEDMTAKVNELKQLGLSAFSSYVNGKYAVRTGEYDTHSEAESAMAQVSQLSGMAFSVVGYSNTCYTVTVTGTNTILFEFDNGGQAMGIMPIALNGIKPQTWFKGYMYYGGFEYSRVNGNDITVISVVTEDDYAKGVIPYEMNAKWPVEALKAQALCAKSYAYNCLGKHKSQGFDLCNTTDCQVYQGVNSATANSDAAVDAVSGKYVLYNGKIAQTYYHASSGGHTENVENIWTNYVPYLRGVPDDYLQYVKSGYESWTYSITLSTIKNILELKGYNVSEVTDYYVSKYSEFGNALQVTIVDRYNGKMTFSGDKARTILNSSTYNISTKSHRYTVSQRGGVYIGNKEATNGISGLFGIGKDLITKALTGSFSTLKVLSKDGVTNLDLSSDKSQYIIQGAGSGHNIGMSQWGARGMADKGLDCNAIITHYFTGVTIGNVN